MNKDIKEHLNNLINNFNNMAYTEQQEELLELYKTGEVKYVDVVDRYSDLSKNYKKLQQENQQLKIQVSSREEVANKYKEIIDEVREVINKMISTGYADETKMYMATYENSEFGTRAKVLLHILDKY